MSDDAEDVLRCRAAWHEPGAAVESFEAASRALTLARGEGLPGRGSGRVHPGHGTGRAADARLLTEIERLKARLLKPRLSVAGARSGCVGDSRRIRPERKLK